MTDASLSPMHFAVELFVGADSQMHGQVTSEGLSGPVPFSGWLDFLRVWEALVPGRLGRTNGPA